MRTKFGLGEGGWEFPLTIFKGWLKKSGTRFQRLPRKSNLKEPLQTQTRAMAERPNRGHKLKSTQRIF
jgi:hypothetical protein